MFKNYFFGFGIVALAAAGAVAVSTGCGKKGSDNPAAVIGDVISGLNEGDAITISGTLSLAGGDASLNLTGSTVAVTDLSVYCVSFSMPPVAGTGAVAADGSFSISLAAAQVAVGCFILDSSNEQVGTLVFENPAKKNLDGTSKTDSKQAFAGNVALGAVILNVATGKAVVDVSQIAVESVKDTSAATATAFDFTGNYVVASAGITLPAGYEPVCPPRVDGQEGDDCGGPSDGQALWVKRITGTSVADGSPVFGIMVWESEERFESCGSKLGMSYADARANAGVELSASGIAEGAFDWDITNYVDGWKSVDATARWDMMKMENVENFNGTGYRGMKQYFKQYRDDSCDQGICGTGEPGASGYMFNADTQFTGCRLADNTPYQLHDWSSMTCNGEDLGNGLHKSTCSTTLGSVGLVTCINIGGAFNLDGEPIGNVKVNYPEDFDVIVSGPSCSDDSQLNWGEDGPTCSGVATLLPGDLCSAIPEVDDEGNPDDQARLIKLRCYADGLWERAREATSCVREITTNWSATTPAEFLVENGPVRAMGQYIFEGFNYDSPNSGSFSNEEVRYQGIRDGNNWTDCKVIERFSMGIRKMDGSDDLLAEMVSETRNASSKPACVAEYGEPQVMKSIFKMVKQP